MVVILSILLLVALIVFGISIYNRLVRMSNLKNEAERH